MKCGGLQTCRISLELVNCPTCRIQRKFSNDGNSVFARMILFPTTIHAKTFHRFRLKNATIFLKSIGMVVRA